jgi:hypothetical protein
MNFQALSSIDREELEAPADALLPTQYADMRRNPEAQGPELRLRLAILEDAVRCHRRYRRATRPRARRIFGETDRWFAVDEPRWPG